MKSIQVTKIKELKGHTGSIYAIIPMGDGKRILSAGGDGMIVEWNPLESDDGKLISKVDTNIFSLALVPRLSSPFPLLLAGQMQGGIHIIDLDEKKEIKHLAYHDKGVYDIREHDGKIYCAGGDGILSIWNSDDFQLLFGLKVSEASLRSFDFQPHPALPIAIGTKGEGKGNEMAIGCSDNFVYILNPEGHKIVAKLEKHTNSVFAVRYSPDGKYLLTGGRDAQLCVWNADTYELEKTIPAHMQTVNDIQFFDPPLAPPSPREGNKARLLATASRDKTIKIWDAENFDLLKVIDKEKMGGHKNSVNKVLWLDEKTLVSCGDDRMIMVWEVTP